AKYAPILEHFKCGKLKLEEAFCEAGDRLVEMGYLRLRYCIAQWPRCRLDPATEKPLLVRKFRLLLRNKMPHRLAQRGDMVLGLARPAAAAEAQRGQVGAQLGKRRLIRVTDAIGAGIKGNRRLAGADEGGLVLFAHCVRVGAGRRAGEFAPRRRDAALLPNGLPQRTQWNGSASFSVTACFACAPMSSRGTSSIASSGQVSAHRPHCTQLRSMKRSRGASAASSSALSGQAPMQALHSVQVCLLTARAPNGAPAGSLI